MQPQPPRQILALVSLSVSRHFHMHIGLKIGISLVALAMAAMHQWLPHFRVDAITLSLLGIAILPWILKHVSGFEVPGVGRIDLKDTKAATDKLNFDAKPKSGRATLKSYAPSVLVGGTDDTGNVLRNIAETDANLALVAFRIEIESRVRALARVNELVSERVSLSRMIRALVSKDIIDSRTGSGLLDIVALGNQAAHGAEVTEDAARWVLDTGPGILLELDKILASNTDDG